MKRRFNHRSHAGLAGSLAFLAIGALSMSAAATSSAQHHAAAHAAPSLDGTVTAHLHLVRPDGTRLYEEGPVTGSLPGSMRAVIDTGKLFTGAFTIDTHGGSIEGRGTGTPHGRGRYQSFSGTLTITGGSGWYSHAHGRAGLYGTFDRRTYAVVIQTTGSFQY